MFRRCKTVLWTGLATLCMVMLGYNLLYLLNRSRVREISKYVSFNKLSWEMKSILQKMNTTSKKSLLVWKNGEETHPYFLSPVMKFEKDKYRIRTAYNLSAIGDLYSKKRTDEKIILYYNLPTWHTMETRYKNSLKNCRLQGCKFTDDRSYLSKADAVIFFVLDIVTDTPPPKADNQMWIFFAHEAPFLWNRWNQLFNWTMTFRFDSDIVCPYFVLKPKLEPDLRDFMEISKRKSKVIMWLVSHCGARSKRDEYVQELTRHVAVDVYGACGSMECPSTGSDSCSNIQNTVYKFYLAFENSLCRGYITEKLFHCYLIDIVPVVRGGSRYAELLPEGTYINTADYESPRKLAEYLKYLDSNNTAYSEYLLRKSQFTITHRDSTLDASICDICVKLHDINRFANTYYDINKWWNTDSCQEATDVKIIPK